MSKAFATRSLLASLFILLLASSSTLSAVTMLKFVNHIPAMKIGAQEMPARADTLTYWISQERARGSVVADIPTIFDGKTDSLYMLYPKFKTYMVHYAGEKPNDSRTDSMKLFEEGLSELRPQVITEVTETDSFKTINGYKCRKYLNSQKMPGIGSAQVTETWATEDIKINCEMLNGIMYGSMKGLAGADKSTDEMRKIKGVQVFSVGKVEMQMEGFSVPKSETRFELIEVKEVQVPDDWFEIPKDFELYEDE